MTTNSTHSLSREALFRQFGPLIGATLLLLISWDATDVQDYFSDAVLWAAGLIALAIILTIVVPWHRLPRFAMMIPPLVYVVGASGFAPDRGQSMTSWAGLFLLPVLWLSLYGTGIELAAGIAAVGLAIFSPLAISAGSRPDPGQALAFIALASALGIGCHRLFDEVRSRLGASAGLSKTDLLTGVSTKRAWEGSLANNLAEARRVGTPVSVAILDVDYFRAYNERFGEQAGDRLLKLFTARWQSELRGGDLLARMGEDEFAVLLPKSHLEAAGAVIRRMCSVPASTTTSAGVASWNGDESMQDLIGRAHGALFMAKQEGRSRIVLAETPPRPAPPRSPDNRTPDIHFEPTNDQV